MWEWWCKRQGNGVQCCCGGVWLDSTINSPTFANKEELGLLVNCRIQSGPAVAVLCLVSLIFAPPVLHPTDHFLDRKVFYLLVPLIFFLLPGILIAIDSKQEC